MRNPLKPRDAVIMAIKRETYDVLTYTLVLKDGGEFSFKPGQFNMVGLPGMGEAPISISSKPSRLPLSPSTEPFDGPLVLWPQGQRAQDKLRTSAVEVRESFDHTIRSVGNVTRALANLEEGDEVMIRGPYGSSWPLDEARGKDILIVAGGIGLAPLRSFIFHIFENRADFGYLEILYGARTPDDMLYTQEFPQWRKQEKVKLLLTVDQVPEGEAWEYGIGVVTELFDFVEIPPASGIALTCGPEIMMRFVTMGLLQRGFSPGRVYLSMERRMKCGIAHCGHCQIGPKYVCQDGPVFTYRALRGLPDTLL